MEVFEISSDYIELNKLLKASGLCDTGGMAKLAIENGLVAVDGKIEFRKRCKIKTGHRVEFEGRSIEVVAATMKPHG